MPTVGVPGRGLLRVFDFDTKLPMAPTATGRDGFAPGCRISFGDLGFVASAEGELQLDPAATPVQVLTFGSLNFVIYSLGGILDYIADRSVELNLDVGDQVPTRLRATVEQPASEGGALPRAHDVAANTYTSTYPPAASTFVGMAGYDSASIFDLLGDSAEDSSSDAGDSDVALAPRECYMVNLANDISDGANGGANGGAPSDMTGYIAAPIVQQTPESLEAQRMRRADLLSARLEREEAELGMRAPPRAQENHQDVARDEPQSLYFAGQPRTSPRWR
jgi:hypothetical protein